MAATAKKPRAKAKPKAKVIQLTPEQDEKHHCIYCKRDFVFENSLINHVCEKKRRILNRDEKYVKLGHMAYQRFYSLQYPQRTVPTYEQFANSRYYTGFTGFGRYVLDIKAVRPEHFIDFVIRMSIPLKNWTSPQIYETYVREQIKKMPPEAALEQGVLLAQSWSQQSGEPWNDFFRKINPNLAVQWIRAGRINPWVLYACTSAQEMLGRMSKEQVALIGEYVDPGFWKARIRLKKQDFEWVKQQLTEVGM